MTSALSLATLGLGGAAAAAASAYLGLRQLDRWCPRIPLEQIPQSSACRHFVESARADMSGDGLPAPMGCDKPSGLLSAWPNAGLLTGKGGTKTRWIPSFVALQTEVPVSLLASYGGDSKAADPESLMRNLMAAFLDARARGPDAWLLDRKVPPRSFEPGSHLFGDRGGLGAVMLGTWSSRLKTALQPRALRPDVPQPTCEFPSNEAVVSRTPSSAGGVIYWNFPASVVQGVDTAASYGMPWRLMEGGFQEFVVQKISDETARVTYICVEASNLHPRGQARKDFKRPPWLFYEAHVAYAQVLLLRAVRQMKRVRST